MLSNSTWEYLLKKGILKINNNKISLIPGLLLFFMMLFVPSAYQETKALLIGFTILIILWLIIKQKTIHLAPQVFVWVLVWIISGFLFVIRGFIYENPGAIRVSTVYIIWPIIYLIFITGITKVDTVVKLFKVLIYSSIAIGLYAISYILYSYGWLPDLFYIELNMRQSIAFYTDMIAYSMNNTGTLIFLVPFLISLLIIWPKNFNLKFNKMYVVTGLVLGIILTLLSGRRVLQILVVFTPFIIMFYQFFLPKNDRMLVWGRIRGTVIFILISGLSIYLVINQIYNFNIIAILNDIINGFNSSSDEGASLRSLQFTALLNGWMENPLLGSGHGASAPGMIRSEEMPWAYELSYVAYLFHTGIIGFIIFISQLLWISFMSIKIIKSESELKFYIIPVIVGTTSFLIANATNPYLAKYDFMWVLFLPLAIINKWLLYEKSVPKFKGETQ